MQTIRILKHTRLIHNISMAVRTVQVNHTPPPPILDPIIILNGYFRKRNAVAYHLQYGKRVYRYLQYLVHMKEN